MSNTKTPATMKDFHAGQQFKAGAMRVTAAEIIAFAEKYDPQYFHLDATLAKQSLFGGLVASGWHTAAMTMRMILDAIPPIKGGMIGRHVEKMNWPRPVYPDDVLSFVGEVIDIRPSNSNPQLAVMRVKNTTYNQKNEVVLETESIIFVPRD